MRSYLENHSASMRMLAVWQSAHGLARRTRVFMRARFRGTTLKQLKIDSGSETIRRQSRFPEKIGANTSSDVTSGSRERKWCRTLRNPMGQGMRLVSGMASPYGTSGVEG